MKRFLPLIATILLLASCASKKIVSDNITTPSTSHPTKNDNNNTSNAEQTAFLHRIIANQQTANNIVASASFQLVGGGKDLSCDGKFSMRRDEMIRLQLLLPIIRSEIARIDFTPEYVLLVDRFHKEYIKASYKEVSFLADNGISFYSLQALFWNQLFLPGEKTVSDNMLKKFACNLANAVATVPVTHKNGNISYEWTADKTTAQIKAANISYKSAQTGTSSLQWTYGNFKTLGGKTFPLSQQFTVNTVINGKKQQAKLTIDMNSAKNSSDWDTNTELSSKYKKIEAKDILKKLLSIQ